MKQKIIVNATMSILQIIIVALIIFFLYRFLLQTIGAKQIGLWSLVLASTSLSQVANLGIPGGVVKYVAKYAARKDNGAISAVLQTSLLSTGTVMGLILLLLYPFICYTLAFFIDDLLLPNALKLVPIALIAVWFSSLTSIVTSGLDGLQQSYLRSILNIISTIFYAIICVVSVQKYSLNGLAYAQLLQNVLVLFGGICILRRKIGLPLIPYRWNRQLFNEMLNYNISFQIISISTLLYQPATKAILSRTAGLELVGYYEMASNLVLQLRSIITSSNQVLVPAIASLTESSPNKIKNVYAESASIIFFISVPFYTMIAITIPLFSKLWIGNYHSFFITTAELLTFAYFLNTLATPAYVTYLGNGQLKWPMVGHMAIALINIILGWGLGLLFNGLGVVIGWVIAIISGSLIYVTTYHIETQCPWQIWSSRANLLLLYASCAILALIMSIYKFTPISIQNNYLLVLITLCISLVSGIFFIPLWQHPVRHKMQTWIFDMVRLT